MADRPLRVVIAPDSFGGSLDSVASAEAVAEGWARARPGDAIRPIPMADGGEGTLAAVAAALGPAAERRTATVRDPRGRAVEAAWLLLDGGTTALVEMATASGLALVPVAERTPENAAAASSRGTGELLLAALDGGAGRIVLGLGGSATTDGGAGMLAALGVRLLDADANLLPPDGAALARLARIDTSGIDPRLASVELVVASDVTNPLTGETGAAAVYGPQKGADAATVERLDAALATFGSALAAATGRQVADLPGAGAAGGTGAALLACTGASMRPGFAVVAELVGLEAALGDADLVITGEGRVDAQTLAGKTAAGVAVMAARRGTPTVLLCGALGPGHEAVVASGAFALVQPIPDRPMALAEAMADARRLLAGAAERLARTIGTGMALAVGGGAPGSDRTPV
jgi:glycerate kinase